MVPRSALRRWFVRASSCVGHGRDINSFITSFIVREKACTMVECNRANARFFISEKNKEWDQVLRPHLFVGFLTSFNYFRRVQTNGVFVRFTLHNNDVPSSMNTRIIAYFCTCKVSRGKLKTDDAANTILAASVWLKSSYCICMHTIMLFVLACSVGLAGWRGN